MKIQLLVYLLASFALQTLVAPARLSAEVDQIGITAVFVSDFDHAKDWYTNQFGLKVVRETVFGPGPGDRWIELATKGDSGMHIVFKLGTPITHQGQDASKPEAILTVYTDDLEKTAAELKARGVRFALEPAHHPWAFEAMVLDQDGQGIVIAEKK